MDYSVHSFRAETYHFLQLLPPDLLLLEDQTDYIQVDRIQRRSFVNNDLEQRLKSRLSARSEHKLAELRIT